MGRRKAHDRAIKKSYVNPYSRVVGGSPNVSNIGEALNNIQASKVELDIAEQILLQKGLESDNPHDIIKAQNIVKIKMNQGTDNRKATFIDPLSFNDSFGYKAPPQRITYDTLWSMSKQPVINAIIKTRKSQIAKFSQPQKDKFSTGFIIRKRDVRTDSKESKEDLARIDWLTEFILNTGADQSWGRDDFDTFLRKFVEDSLIFDQACFEVVRKNNGEIHEFVAIDSSSIRIADSYNDTNYVGDRKKVGGYYPSYVQTLQSGVIAEFYSWELCFATRNPTTRIYSNSYGRSELEDMVAIITSMLWADEYNRNFFKTGSAPKGILKVKGGVNQATLSDFKQQFRAMTSGVANAWKIPILDGESVDWIDMQKGSRDMEFSKWQEYLVKLGCALYIIDPSEIGFASGQSSEGGAMFEANNEKKLKYSKDKGLTPLLKFIQQKINKYIVSQIYPDLYFEFVGLDSETENEHLARIKDEVSYYKTLNEVREAEGLKPIEGGDIPLNSTFIQKLQQDMMAQQMAEQSGGGEEASDEEYNSEESDDNSNDEENNWDSESDSQKDASEVFKGGESSPFAKDFNSMIERLEKGYL
jgi:hypothetical protein